MTVPQKVLIVEDMVTQAIRLQGLLKNGGVASTTIVRSADETLKALSQDHVWDAIISDINMPETDGFELCKKIKQNDLWKQIPVLLLVSLKDPRDAIKAMEAGANNILVKEYDKDYFIPQLAAACTNAKEDGSQAQSTKVMVGGEWHEFSMSANQLAAFALSAYAMAMREKAARLKEPASTLTQ